MAFYIKRSELPEECEHIIRKYLVIKPKSDSKYKSSSNLIYFFQNEDEIIKLPLMFSASLLKIIPNINHDFLDVDFEFKGKLRPIQESVEDEAWNYLTQRGTVTLALHPGFGKTVLGVKLSSRLKLLTVVIAHRDILIRQWEKSFTDFSHATVWVVGENPPTGFNVIICMPGRWKKIHQDIRYKVGLLILDEVHCLCTDSCVGCLLSFQPKHIIALSATPERDDNLHQMLYALCGEHAIYRQSEIPFEVVKVNTGFIPAREYNKDGSVKWNSILKDTANSVARNDLILNLVKDNSQHYILILTKMVDHAKLLHNLISEFEPSCDFLCGTKKNHNDCKVLIGTISKIGTGYDQASSCHNYSGNRFNILILATSVKKYSTLIQTVGRVFRSENPLVYHLVDNDSIIKSHWYFCRKFYLSRNAKLSEIVI
jgi:superfamily II DNA or RNA helicase